MIESSFYGCVDQSLLLKACYPIFPSTVYTCTVQFNDCNVFQIEKSLFRLRRYNQFPAIFAIISDCSVRDFSTNKLSLNRNEKVN